MQRNKQSSKRPQTVKKSASHTKSTPKTAPRRQKARTMSTSVKDNVSKIAQKRLEFQLNRPYNAEKLLAFDGHHNDAAFMATLDAEGTVPFKYKAVGMTYHVGTGIDNEYVTNSLTQKKATDNDSDDDEAPQLVTVDFVTQQQLKKGDFAAMFPHLGDAGKMALKAHNFAGKQEQIATLFNSQTAGPSLLVGLGDVIDGVSNSAKDHLNIVDLKSTIHAVTKHIATTIKSPNVVINVPDLYLTKQIKNGYGSGAGIPDDDQFQPEKTPEQKAADKAKPAAPNQPPATDAVAVEDVLAAIIRTATAANHHSDRHIDPKNAGDDFIHIEQLFLRPPTTQKPTTPVNRHVYNAVNLAESEVLTREIGNEPSNIVTTLKMVDYCQQLAKTHPKTLKLKVHDKDELKALGHELIVSVGTASTPANPPAIALFEYNNMKPGVSPNEKPANALIGKTLVFDTGALELKAWKHMCGMEFDKMGGVSTLAVTRSLALNAPKLSNRVITALAIAENAIGSNSTHPGSIFTEPNGVSVSVVSPDAEGRLALASAMVLVQNHNIENNQGNRVKQIYTMATLTGSVMVGLGTYAAGVFTNNNALARQFIAKSVTEHNEWYWQMPLFPQHAKNIKGTRSDLVNCSMGSLSDASNAGAFLSHFLQKGTTLMHLDIAGVANLDDEEGIQPAGATGFGVHSVYSQLVAEGNGVYKQ